MNVRNLFRLQIDERMDLLRKGNKKAMVKAIALGVAVVFAAIVAIYLLANRMKIIGVSFGKDTFALVLFVTQLISFFLTLGSVINTLYTNKDNELLMSLPVSHNEVFVSKIIVLYVSEAYANVLYTLPICIAFGLIGGYSTAYYFMILPILLLLTVIPLALATVLSLPVFAVISYLKKHFVASVITVVVVASVAVWGYVSLVLKLGEMFNLTGQQIQTVEKINTFLTSTVKYNPIFVWIAEAMFLDGFAWKYPVLFVGSVAVFALGITVCKPFYFKMAMKSGETASSQTQKITADKELSPTASLFVKELKTVFRSPGYVFQYFIFTILMPLIVVVYDKLMLSVTVSQIGANMIDGAHVLIVGIIAMLSNVISATALSREGGNFYLMKTCPVDVHKQAYVKILFNAVFTLTAVVITCITASLFYGFAWWKTVLQIVAISLASIGHICICFKYDLMNPSLDWYDTSEITSLSKSSTKGMLVGLLVAVVLGLVLMFNAYNVVKAYVMLVLFGLLLCASELYMLHERLHYYFRRMEI